VTGEGQSATAAPSTDAANEVVFAQAVAFPAGSVERVDFGFAKSKADTQLSFRGSAAFESDHQGTKEVRLTRPAGAKDLPILKYTVVRPKSTGSDDAATITGSIDLTNAAERAGIFVRLPVEGFGFTGGTGTQHRDVPCVDISVNSVKFTSDLQPLRGDESNLEFGVIENIDYGFKAANAPEDADSDQKAPLNEGDLIGGVRDKGVFETPSPFRAYSVEGAGSGSAAGGGGGSATGADAATGAAPAATAPASAASGSTVM